MKNFSICILCVILISTLFSGCHRHSSENIDESYEVVVSDVPEEDMSSGINNLQELISFLTEQKEKGHLINTVVYPHPLTDDDFDLLCSSTGSMCTSYTSSGDEYTFTLTLYPGDRIAQAYFSGDTSQLKEDEIKV